MKKCLLCGKPLNSPLGLDFLLNFKAYRPPVICRDCRNRFELISTDHCCKECSRPGSFKGNLCSDCRRWRRISKYPFRNYALYRYNSMMSEYMHRYKFQGDYRLRRVFQRDLSRFVNQFERTVVPIPIHPNTYRSRGFNQVLGLLKGVKIVEALTTVSNHKNVPQSRKSKEDRLKLPQPFKIMNGSRDLIVGHDLLVVDDVYTTGMTARHATGLLNELGAKSVVSVTLAR